MPSPTSPTAPNYAGQRHRVRAAARSTLHSVGRACTGAESRPDAIIDRWPGRWGLTVLDSVRELRRDHFGLIRHVVAADAHVENEVRHRLQDMLTMVARHLA